MMEKYATELNSIQATPDQIKTLKNLCLKTGVEFQNPSSFQEAEELILELEMIKENGTQ